MKSIMSRFVCRLALPVVLVFLLTSAAFGEVWGSAKSKSYHLASCRYVKKTAKANRIQFNSAADARDAGYKPCEVCNPPKGGVPKPVPDKSGQGTGVVAPAR